MADQMAVDGEDPRGTKRKAEDARLVTPAPKRIKVAIHDQSLDLAG